MRAMLELIEYLVVQNVRHAIKGVIPEPIRKRL